MIKQNISQVNSNVKKKSNQSLVTLGLSSSYNWLDDPKRLLFTLSKYKFVSKIFHNRNRVLEIGCGDGFASYLVSKSVKYLICSDIDPDYIRSAINTIGKHTPNTKFQTLDFLDNQSIAKIGKFDGIYCLDVLEHISKKNEDIFLNNVCHNLKPNGTFIVGMPSLESQKYASKLSKAGHINCKTTSQLQKKLQKYFGLVVTFGANDEIIHTGFDQMRHYNLAVCHNPLKIK